MSNGWARPYVKALKNGMGVTFRPKGHSMEPRVCHDQYCRVEPVKPEDVRVGDVVLCTVNGRDYLHLVKAISGGKYQIGNNRGGVNGWIEAQRIYGRLSE